MGAPRRNRKKFNKPKNVYNLIRIEADRALIKEYGLKNMRELWMVQTELSRLRRNVRMLLAGTPGLEGVQEGIVSRLFNLGIIGNDVQLDMILGLKEDDLLNRRLQSRVFRNGLARSMKQARQLITHGFISIEDIKIDRPGYVVRLKEEDRIGYYKPIKISPIAEKVNEDVKEDIKEGIEEKIEDKEIIKNDDVDGKEE